MPTAIFNWIDAEPEPIVLFIGFKLCAYLECLQWSVIARKNAAVFVFTFKNEIYIKYKKIGIVIMAIRLDISASLAPV